MKKLVGVGLSWNSPTVILAKTSGKFFSSQCLHFAGSGIYSQYCKHESIDSVIPPTKLKYLKW